MEILYRILTIINTGLLALMGVAFGLQVIYFLLFFLPAKKYKKAEKKHRFGIIIPAKNEESIIAETIKSIRNQNYPAELFDIFVIADNCTDATAATAREHGATVFERFDTDPAHHKVSYALKHCFEQILSGYDHYDAFIRFDADNYVHPDYITKMNDAFDSGVQLARGYNNAKNLTENTISCISGLWYIRDCRFSCQVRSRLGMSQIMVGSGMMISADIVRKNGGWTDMGFCEDADFSISEFLKGNKCEYVSEAMVYEDQPTTIKDTFRRNMRLGRGLHSTFWKYGTRCFGKFFSTFKFSYLDLFLTELFIPIALICCLWLPFYYIFGLSYNIAIGNSAEWQLLLDVMGKALLFAFVIPFILQALVVYFLERKRINKSFFKVLPGILLFPVFMIFYAAGIAFGILTNAKWKSVTRSQNSDYASMHDYFSNNSEMRIQENILTYTDQFLQEATPPLQETDCDTVKKLIFSTGTSEEVLQEAAAAEDRDQEITLEIMSLDGAESNLWTDALKPDRMYDSSLTEDRVIIHEATTLQGKEEDGEEELDMRS